MTSPGYLVTRIYFFFFSGKHPFLSPSSISDQKKTKIALVEALDHSVTVDGINRTRTLRVTELEDALNDTELSSSGVETSDGHPVVDDHASADDAGAAVDTACDERDLQ